MATVTWPDTRDDPPTDHLYRSARARPDLGRGAGGVPVRHRPGTDGLAGPAHRGVLNGYCGGGGHRPRRPSERARTSSGLPLVDDVLQADRGFQGSSEGV